MGLFRRRRADHDPQPVEEPVEERAINTAAAWAWVKAQHAYGTKAGPSVSLDSAMQSAAVWACVRVLTAAVVSLPVDVVRVTGGKRTPVDPQPLLIRRPSPSVRARAWRGQVIRSQLMSGNAYGEVLEVDSMQRPTQIEVIHPGSVTWAVHERVMKPHVNGRPRDVWPIGDFWHLPVSHLMMPGVPYALSPVQHARESIGTALAAEQFGAEFFAAGGHPSTVLRPDFDPGPDGAEALKEAYLAATVGRRPAVIPKTVDIEKIQTDPTDSQFLDLMRFEVEQACRWFGVPPSMVYAATSGQNVTYANVSNADLHFLKYSVGHWVQDLEEALSEMIVAPQIVRFNTSAILRMDEKLRAEIHKIRIDTGTRTQNEVRVLEDEEPFGDPTDPDNPFNQPRQAGGATGPTTPAT